MDREVRGKISELLDKAYEKQNFINTSFWALEADENIKSEEDFALGYMIGALANIANRMVLDKKAEDKKRRYLIKKWGKEEYEKMQEQIRMGERELQAKGVKPARIDTTDLQYNKVKNMIIPMIAQFRTKISNELALKQAKGR